MKKVVVLLAILVLTLIMLRLVQYYIFYPHKPNFELAPSNVSQYIHNDTIHKHLGFPNTSIKSVRLIEETISSATLEVTYDYGGSYYKKMRVWVGAKRIGDGKLMPWSGYKPGRVLEGKSLKTKVLLTLIDRSADQSESDSILLNVYFGNGDEVHEEAFELQKHWCKVRAAWWNVFATCQ